MEGHKLGTIPGEFAGGIGDQGVANLREFIKDGGTLVTLGNASRFAIEQLNLPVKDVLKDLKSQDFFCSGSILKADIRESGHPILFGLTRDPAVFFARNGAFETQRDFKGSALLGYAKDENPLLSGYLLHPEKIQGKIAALDVQYGKGHIILAGFRPQWRGQTHGMYKFFFNSLFYFGSATITPAGMQMAARPSRAADWLKLADAIRIDLEKVFEQNLKFAAARGAQATGEGKRFDELVEKMQATHFPELDELKAGVARSAQQKIDEYKTQLKAALIDMRGKEFSTVKFTLSDLRVQFRLDKLEQEISDLLK
jgi:hypothetical protein